MLFGARQECNKFVRRGAQVANAAIRWQRAYVQQNTRGSLEFHDADLTGWIGVPEGRRI
jgi:hypothetical protein